MQKIRFVVLMPLSLCLIQPSVQAQNKKVQNFSSVFVDATRTITTSTDESKDFGPSDPILSSQNFIAVMAGSYVGVQSGEASGVEECIMRYGVESGYEKNGIHYFPHVDPLHIKGTTIATLIQFSGTMLCDDKTGTGVNTSPNSYYGDATNGDCKSQVNVKDFKQP